MPSLSNVVIIGSGLMGHGIALVHASAGCTVTLVDLQQSALDNAADHILNALATLVDAGEITTEHASASFQRIRFTTSLLDSIKQANLVIEAITEDPSVKERLFASLADVLPPTAVLASNTSYLDIFPLLPSSLRDRSFIVHWYTPPYIIDLIEVIPCEGVQEHIVDQLMLFLKGLGKKPMRMRKFVPGYLANRIQMAIESEIFRLLDDGVAAVDEIDQSIMEGLALRLALYGQFRKIDYTGLRVVRDSHDREAYVPPTPPTTSRRLARLVDDGHLGVSTGQGFYTYRENTPDVLFEARDRELLAAKRAINTIKQARTVWNDESNATR